MVKTVCVHAWTCVCLQPTLPAYTLSFPCSLLCSIFTTPFLSGLLRKAREAVPEEATSGRTGKAGTEKQLP